MAAHELLTPMLRRHLNLAPSNPRGRGVVLPRTEHGAHEHAVRTLGSHDGVVLSGATPSALQASHSGTHGE